MFALLTETLVAIATISIGMQLNETHAKCLALLRQSHKITISLILLS